MFKSIYDLLRGTKGKDEEKGIPEFLRDARLPNHIAIIMDGNGRWAGRRGLPRLVGHRAGIQAAKRTINACLDFNIPVLSLYVFSTENWKRPKDEVSGLMNIMEEALINELAELNEKGARVLISGDLAGLPKSLSRGIEEAMELTKDNDRLVTNFVLNYGGRCEILRAIKLIAEEVKAGRLSPDDIDKNLFESYLYTAGLPDPDLLIRTAGERRISNFLIWQAVYAEFWTTPVYWPDFGREQLLEALEDYQTRQRKFGDLKGSSKRPIGDIALQEKIAQLRNVK